MSQVAKKNFRHSHGNSNKKPAKKPRYNKIFKSYVPIAERIRMCQEYMTGGPDNSIRQIAMRFNRDEATVNRIVKSPEVEEIGQAMAARLLQEAADHVAARIEHEVKTKKSKAGAWIAMELAERWGAIPAKISRAALLGQFLHKHQNGKERTEEERVTDIVRQLTEVTMERGRIFGMPMPEIDELKDEEIEIPLHAKPQEE